MLLVIFNAISLIFTSLTEVNYAVASNFYHGWLGLLVCRKIYGAPSSLGPKTPNSSLMRRNLSDIFFVVRVKINNVLFVCQRYLVLF